MKRLAAIILALAMLSGCAQRFDGSAPGSTPSPTPGQTATRQPLPATPQPSMDVAATGGILPTPQPTLGGATGGLISPLPTPKPSESPSPDPSLGISPFPRKAVLKGLSDAPILLGKEVEVGDFLVTIPGNWMAADNYEQDEQVESINGVYRFESDEDRLVVSALDMTNVYLDLEDEDDIMYMLTYNTSYHWMEYISHDVVDTPLGKALFWRVDASAEAPYSDQPYVGMGMLLPLGDQALSLGISIPEAAGESSQEGAWRLLAGIAAGSKFSTAASDT